MEVGQGMRSDPVMGRNPTVSLLVVFVLWKALLISLAVLSPGLGYDTSAGIILGQTGHQSNQLQLQSLPVRMALTHLRWDAFYFAGAAQRGYVYEQEWAFSRTYSFLMAAVKDLLFGDGESPLKVYVWAAILVSNLFHFISVIVLYRLARAISKPHSSDKIAFISSVLHIISPAGLFLSAPYAESLFSSLNFAGMLLYVHARRTERAHGAWRISQDAYMLCSGMAFALATLVRSNGLLSGTIFLYDVLQLVPRTIALKLSMHDAHRTLATCAAGALIALAFITPQAFAYHQYCIENELSRPWCRELIPSIYSWVQEHYWNVGFLRYWTVPNIPLFILAIPMLCLLASTAITVLQGSLYPSTPKSHKESSSGVGGELHGTCDFRHLAIPQLLLALSATTSFHVQIINRLSSGYPIWYITVAGWIAHQAATPVDRRVVQYSQCVVRGSVLYAIIQGMLFASFLPPA